MKLFKTLFYPVLCALMLGACKEEDNNPVPGVGGSMTATVDGSTWAATFTSYNKFNDTVQFVGERSATSSDGRGAGVQIASYSGPNSYTINGTQNRAYVIVNNVRYDAGSGSVGVSLDDDTWFKASFSFEATDSLNTATRQVSGSFSYRKK